jgi:hypothetical protein
MRRRYCNRITAGPSFLPQPPTIPAFIDSALVKPRAGLEGQAAIRQLAEDMRQAAHREGGLSRDELQLMGWTSTQLDELAGRARIRAQSLAGMTL